MVEAGIPGDPTPAEAAAVVRSAGGPQPSVALILGSGLSPVADRIAEEASVLFGDLPGFAPSPVPGHEGRVALGRLGGVPMAAFRGRVHFYEGGGMAAATLPVRVAAELGVHTVVVTAAAGGVDPALGPGALVVLTDHLNFMGANPLEGWRRADGSPPFVDLAGAYDPGLAAAVLDHAAAVGVRATRGIYAAFAGPSYETPAEIAFLRSAGAAVVGMSVVPEVVPARALGLRVLGVAAVANAAGAAVEHTEVVRVVGEAAGALGRLLEETAPDLGSRPA